MLVRTIVLLISFMLAAVTQAVPISANESCTEGQANCAEESSRGQAENGVVGEASVEQNIVADAEISGDASSLIGFRLIGSDVARLLDEQTTSMFITAFYPVSRGHNLIDHYLTGGSGGTFPDRFSAGHNYGNSRGKDWSILDQKGRPGRYNGSMEQGTIAETEAGWIIKSASVIDYAVVAILCIVFGLWFRQSKAY